MAEGQESDFFHGWASLPGASGARKADSVWLCPFPQVKRELPIDPVFDVCHLRCGLAHDMLGFGGRCTHDLFGKPDATFPDHALIDGRHT